MMSREDQLSGIDPATYAPYEDPRDYITSWADKIWISRGLGHLRDHYVKVHTAYGETYGFESCLEYHQLSQGRASTAIVKCVR